MALGGLRHIADDPSILAAISPTYGLVVSRPPWDARSVGPRGRVPGRHGRGGALRRHGPFRPTPDPDRLARAGAAVARPELHRAGRLAPGRPEQAREPVLPALPGLGAAADGRDGDDRHHHRQPGRDHRRLLADPAGDPARASAADGDPVDLGDREGPDLRAPDQLPFCSWPCCSWWSTFKSSSALAHAYGIAVTGTMVVTAVLAFFVVWRCWRWPLWAAVSVVAPFLLVDLIFLAANALKIPQGGWMPLVVGAVLMIADDDLAAGHAHPGREDPQDGRAARSNSSACWRRASRIG